MMAGLPAAMWIVALIGAFAFLPALILGVLGLKRRFERKVYGRIYAWSGPLSIVSQDGKVATAFGRWRLAVGLYIGGLVVLFVVVSLLVL